MKTKIHYGWIVCAGCTLAMFCCCGLVIQAFSVYMPFLVQRYGLTQTQASLVPTFRSLFSLIFKFLVIWFIDRLNVRRTMGLGFLFVIASFVLYAGNGPYWLIYAAAALAGIGYGLATMVPISILLNRWFREKLALALAFCAASTGVASMIFPPVITGIISRRGLTTAFLLEAAAIALVFLATMLMLRNDPKELGLAPFGRETEKKTEKAAAVQTAAPLSKGQGLVFLAAPLLLGAVAQTASGLFTLHFTGEGFDAMTAALAVSVFGFSLLVGKFVYGFCQDAIGGAKTNLLLLALMLGGVVCACFIRGSAVLLFVSVILIGLGFSVSTVGITMWAKEFSDEKQYANTVRTYQILFMLGSLVFSPCAGMIADLFGSYVPVFALYSVMTAGILAVICWAYRVKTGNRRAA